MRDELWIYPRTRIRAVTVAVAAMRIYKGLGLLSSMCYKQAVAVILFDDLWPHHKSLNSFVAVVFSCGRDEDARSSGRCLLRRIASSSVGESPVKSLLSRDYSCYEMRALISTHLGHCLRAMMVTWWSCGGRWLWPYLGLLIEWQILISDRGGRAARWQLNYTGIGRVDGQSECWRQWMMWLSTDSEISPRWQVDEAAETGICYRIGLPICRVSAESREWNIVLVLVLLAFWLTTRTNLCKTNS